MLILLVIKQVIVRLHNIIIFEGCFGIETSKKKKTLWTINCDRKTSIHKSIVLFNRKNEDPAHTIILTGWDASYRLTCCHNSCSYQIIVPVEIMDVNGER